jgi:hypothetical protein
MTAAQQHCIIAALQHRITAAPSSFPLTGKRVLYYKCFNPIGAGIAQSVEQGTENPRVGGSIPPPGTTLGNHLWLLFFSNPRGDHLTQLPYSTISISKPTSTSKYVKPRLTWPERPRRTQNTAFLLLKYRICLMYFPPVLSSTINDKEAHERKGYAE